VVSDGTGLASDYTVTLTNGNLTVSRALINHTIGNDSHAYGSTANLATDLGTTFNTGINGEKLTITYSSTGNTATAPVGGYSITGIVSSGTGLTLDYNVTLTRGTLTVTPARPIFLGPPLSPSVSAGTNLGLIVIQLQDQLGNTVHQAGIAVTLSLVDLVTGTVGSFSTGATVTVFTNSNGQAVFDNLAINYAGTYELLATTHLGGISEQYSRSFTVLPSMKAVNRRYRS
jgi:hypothetical protein